LLGLAYKAQGDWPLAQRHLTASVHLAPARADFHANLANLWMALQRHQDAIASYRQALQCQRDFRPAWLGLIRALAAAGDPHAASDEARRMLKAHPRDA